MKRRAPLIVVVLLALAAAAVWYARRERGPVHYTGFVEGEERIVRAEVSGRILAVAFAEGEAVPAGSVVARIDDQGIRAQMAAKEQEIAALDAEVRRQKEQVALLEQTWQRDVSAHRADVRQAASAADLAERSFKRERDLTSTGASTQQLLDEARSQREQATSMH
jgi:multidrug resistance efflux pump